MLKAKLREIERLFKGEEAPDRSIFYYDARRAASISFTILTILIISGYLSVHSRLNSKDILFISLMVSFLSFSLLYARVANSYAAFIPFCGFLLIAPIYFNDPNAGAWITYGLLTIIIIIYTIGIQSLRLVLFAIVLLLGMQIFVANLNLESVTDNRDTLLGGTYFSSAWFISVAFGGLWAKYGFFKFYDRIENFYDDLYALRYRQEAMNLRLNLSDNLNSQLHGTVLNTLIALRGNSALRVEKNQLQQMLRADLSKLMISSKVEQDTFENRLLLALNFSAYPAIKVHHKIINFHAINREYEKHIIEIVREVLLNSIKHGGAHQFRVMIERIDQTSRNELGINEEKITVRLVIESDQLPRGSSQDSLADSLTLKRLLSQVDTKLDLEQNVQGTLFSVDIALPLDFSGLLRQIFSLRIAALQYIARTYVAISFAFGALALPGYYFLHLDSTIVVLLGLQSILLFIALYRKKNSFLYASLASILALSVFPVLSLVEGTCTQFQTTPWIFNGVIGSALFLSVIWQRRVIRWIPALIFLLSTQYFSTTLPLECNQLLAGSTPAIVLIVLIALGVGYFRRKSSLKDVEAIESVKQNTSSQLRRELKIEERRREITGELTVFADSVSRLEDDSAELDHALDLQILRLRSFLICSEYFDNQIIDSFYMFITKRFNQGVRTYLNIHADDFSTESNQSQINSLIGKLEMVIGSADVNLIISRGAELEIDIEIVQNAKEVRRQFRAPGIIATIH